MIEARQLSERTLSERLAAHNFPERLLKPFDIWQTNVAPPKKVSGNLLGAAIPYLLILMCMTGAMYPSVDFRRQRSLRHLRRQREQRRLELDADAGERVQPIGDCAGGVPFDRHHGPGHQHHLQRRGHEHLVWAGIRRRRRGLPGLRPAPPGGGWT
jgi:hypothetical protein